MTGAPSERTKSTRCGASACGCCVGVAHQLLGRNSGDSDECAAVHGDRCFLLMDGQPASDWNVPDRGPGAATAGPGSCDLLCRKCDRYPGTLRLLRILLTDLLGSLRRKEAALAGSSAYLNFS